MVIRIYIGLLLILMLVVIPYIIMMSNNLLQTGLTGNKSFKTGLEESFQPNYGTGNSTVDNINGKIRNQDKSSCVKKVLIWWKTDLARKNYGYGGTEGLITCPNFDCSVDISYAENVSKLVDSTIVIFHASYHTDLVDYRLFQSKRYPDQIWIWQTWESPTRVLEYVDKPPGWFKFNLTMSFSSKTDIRVPYGSYVPYERPKHLHSRPNASEINWSHGKTDLIAWVAKNCRATTWARFKFVKHLQTRLPIDIYGQCGNLSCPGWNVPCEALNKYKFILALENSECRDYITEKFWWWPFLYNLNLVPIVYGASKEDYQKVAPPNSFIHISDFDTLDQFVKYINLLDNNKGLYNKYFEWKQMGHVVKGNNYFSPSRICAIVQVQPPKHHNIHNEWWKHTCTQRRQNWHPFINTSSNANQEY
ncbi:galactoside 3(4)-L-fucosyltransferase-like [Anneissia japonica]|uniref:galactoside 3(4)-L-fucosyltransferase-like n=1 Tax=Anneissia japonica TaxID=1529436 RepID=UPI0014259997|nr:galactoside 3(4)-L-fucosyltransferase-like [Anneissia japonica]